MRNRRGTTLDAPSGSSAPTARRVPAEKSRRKLPSTVLAVLAVLVALAYRYALGLLSFETGGVTEVLAAGVATLLAGSAWLYLLVERLTPESTIPTPDGKNKNRWQERWDKGYTLWHRKHVHPMLLKYGDRLLDGRFPDGGARILVPLCGKSLCLTHLASNLKVAQVVGIDFIINGLQQYMANATELKMRPVKNRGKYGAWQGNSLTLLNGDFFDVTTAVTDGPVDAVYDRDGIVALDPCLHDDYVEQLGKLLNPESGRILISTYVMPHGPNFEPFSIPEAQVRRLFEGKPWVESVELLEQHSGWSAEPTLFLSIMQFLFLGWLDELVFLVKTKHPK